MGACLNNRFEYTAPTDPFESKYKNVIDTLVNWWNDNLEVLSDDKYLECALTFYNNLFIKMQSVRDKMQSRDVDLNMQALKMLGMFRWIVLTLTESSLSNGMISALQQLGALHDYLGIVLDDYLAAGDIFHETMSHAFAATYNVRVKWCFNVLYEIMVGVMMGNDFTKLCETQTDKLMLLWGHVNDAENSISDCLDNQYVMTYLPLFMKEQFCIELFLFITDYKKYKLMTNKDDIIRFGEHMKEMYIDSNSAQQINISGVCRNAFYHNLESADNVHTSTFTNISYDDCYEEVIQLIEMSVFPYFKLAIKECVDSINVKAAPAKLVKPPEIDFVKLSKRTNSLFI